MSNILNLLSEETFAEKLDTQNALLAAIAGQSGGLSINSWSDVQKAVRMGLADKIFSVGDQLTCQKGDNTLVWDVIGVDHDTPSDPQFSHSLTLQLHDCFENIQFDETEALYFCGDGLAAGTYHFTLLPGYDETYGGGKTIQFTLTKPVPAGGQIMFPWANNKQSLDTKISTYSDSTSTDVIETVSVTEGNDGTDLGTADGQTPHMNHSQRIRYGSNDYAQSAIRQWLNSDAEANFWWQPCNEFDRPPLSIDTDGFLNGMDEEFLSVLGDVKKKTAVYGSGIAETNEKVFLLSRSEVYGGNEVKEGEGSAYPYYYNYSDLSAERADADTNRIKYNNGSAQHWWLRSPNIAGRHYVRTVYVSGNVNIRNAYGVNAAVPACCII